MLAGVTVERVFIGAVGRMLVGGDTLFFVILRYFLGGRHSEERSDEESNVQISAGWEMDPSPLRGSGWRKKGDAAQDDEGKGTSQDDVKKSAVQDTEGAT